MKTYCKHLIVSDEVKVNTSISDYIHDNGKYRSNKIIDFVCNYYEISKDRYQKEYYPGSDLFQEINKKLAQEMSYAIKTRTVEDMLYKYLYNEKLITYRKINDPGSGKERILGLESTLFRLFEAVAKDAAYPMFSAKLGEYQVASIKGKGQNFGKKAILKWTSRDPEGTRYFAKADIYHCYPSISHDVLLNFIDRDLNKCDDLKYLFHLFIKLYEEYPSPKSEGFGKGILIGSPVSKDLCNYYLSKAYHYAAECLFKNRKKKNGDIQKIRMINHEIFYMDDIIFFSSNKQNLKKSIELFIKFCNDKLKLSIKPNWFIAKFQYIDTNGNKIGNTIDYMGFVFHGGKQHLKYYKYPYNHYKKVKESWATVRDGIFLRARKKYHIFERKIKNYNIVNKSFAISICARYGWFDNSNSYYIIKKERLKILKEIAAKILSDYANEKKYDRNKYYRMWRYMRNGKKSCESCKPKSNRI